MKLKVYQVKYKDKFVEFFNDHIDLDGRFALIIKSCTASGKTVMLAETLKALENNGRKMLWFFIAPNELQLQGKRSFAKNLENTSYKILSPDQINSDKIDPNTIIFINWQSVNRKDFSNLFMAENENGNSLPQIIEWAKSNGYTTGLIVDEGHRNVLSKNSQTLLGLIDPKISYYISATPDYNIQHDEKIEIPRENAVREEMVKKEIWINRVGDDIEENIDSMLFVIKEACECRKNKKNSYEKEGSNVNPLMMVQLPNELPGNKGEVEAMMKVMIDYSIKIGEKLEDIQICLTGIGFADEKAREDFSKNDDHHTIVFFKQGLAEGWDCPRAHVLAIFRESKTETLPIQVAGRLARTPEQKYYNDEELNNAHIFTNSSENTKFTADAFSTNPNEVKDKIAKKKKDCPKLSLPSVYSQRDGYGDLVASIFKPCLEEEFKQISNSIILKDNVSSNVIKNGKLDFDTTLDTIFDNSDTISLNLSQAEIDFAFRKFCMDQASPYAKARSSDVIGARLKYCFRDILSVKTEDFIKISAYILNNRNIISEAIEKAKKKYPDREKLAKKNKKVFFDQVWNMPESMAFSDKCEKKMYKKYMMTKCFLQKERSQPEREYENLLESSTEVNWWIKNGDNGKENFGVKYTKKDTGSDHIFYPDYIILCGEKIYIHDPKEDRDEYAKDKAEALYQYCAKLRSGGMQIYSGITRQIKGVWYINDCPVYTKYSPDNTDWKKLTF
jgi:type III restriction enzyme